MKNMILEFLSTIAVVYLTTGCLIIPIQIFTDLSFEKALTVGLITGFILDLAIPAYVAIRDKRAKKNANIRT